jgi:hypothetical protein
LFNIKVEAVAITKAGASNYLNGENFNLNGRVLSAADADKGYKGAGHLSGSFVLGICSGKAETRSATTAMKVLTSHIEEIKLSREDCEMAINRYFDSARRDVSLLANDYAEISASLLYVYDNNIVIAGLGRGKCFRIADHTVETISAPEEWNTTELAAPYYYNIDNIESQNTFLLCSAGVYEYVSENEIASIIEEAVSPKQAAQKIQNAAIANGSQKDITLILASLVPEASVYAPAGFEGAMPGAYAPNDDTIILPRSVPYHEDAYDYTVPADEKAGSGTSKVPIIIISVLAVILLFLIGIYAYQKVKSQPTDVTTLEPTTEITTEFTTEPTTQGTTESTTELTTGETTEEETTTKATTARTTTRATTRATTRPTTRQTTTTTEPETEPETEPVATEPEIPTIREQPED